eukprot:6630415-Pyramimonas_sp.AAC.1
MGMTACHGNIMAVFAWLPTRPQYALPPPQRPCRLEKTRKLANLWIRFQSERLRAPASGPDAAAPPS